MEHQMKNKDFYALNLNNKNAELIVKNAKDKIEELQRKQEEMQDELSEKRNAMKRAQDDFELTNLIWQELEDQVNENITVINAFSKYDASNSNVKVVRMQGDAVVRKDGKKNIKWLSEAVKLLKEQNRFMDFDEMWNYFVNNDTILKGFAKNKKNENIEWMKTTVVTNFLTHCSYKERKHGTQKLCVYEGKFGLIEWMNTNGSIKPAYLKEFMYATTN
jgi:hypothetical protein